MPVPPRHLRRTRDRAERGPRSAPRRGCLRAASRARRVARRVCRQSQTLSRSYGSCLPTSLTYILRPVGKRLLNLGDLMRNYGTFTVPATAACASRDFQGPTRAAAASVQRYRRCACGNAQGSCQRAFNNLRRIRGDLNGKWPVYRRRTATTSLSRTLLAVARGCLSTRTHGNASARRRRDGGTEIRARSPFPSSRAQVRYDSPADKRCEARNPSATSAFQTTR